MTLRRIQTGRSGPTVNAVLGSLRSTRNGPGTRSSPVKTSTEAAASLTTSLTGTNNDLVYTAKRAGADGNTIRVRYVNPGNNGTLAVAVSGNDISVTLATDGAGVITSTATQVRAAVDASPAHGLVSVANAAANDGTGLVTALAYTALSGGTDPS